MTGEENDWLESGEQRKELVVALFTIHDPTHH
jgi:hypothetical protein